MIKKPEVITITEGDLVKNGFYYRLIKERGKVIRIYIENKKKMYEECLEAVRRMKEY